MGITRDNVNEAIVIDGSQEPILSCDQADVDYPVRFSTVNLSLASTGKLVEMADALRSECGYPPTCCTDYRNGKDCGGCEDCGIKCDADCWYNFSIDLNGYTKSQVDSCITFTVVNTDEEDDERTYYIPLSDEEQGIVRERLDTECRRCFGQDGSELLSEAEKEMSRDG